MTLFMLLMTLLSNNFPPSVQTSWWPVQSIDTVKYSRDLSRAKSADNSFDETIDQQIKNIANTGATHVAIDTPYDDEFLPFLTKWVTAARKYKLNVWFRGNWSGWEGWFDYPPISKEDHINKTRSFISSHAGLFENGDIFTACPECENGVIGDPRKTNQVEEYRSFMISEYQMTKEEFGKIHKAVKSNYSSMNRDVATIVMDRATTSAMDGIVTIDHYVKTGAELKNDVENLVNSSGGKVVLGEFGAPIPDINGFFTDQEQAAWVEDSLRQISSNKNIVAINYWTSYGASTSLWDENGGKPAVSVVSKYYSPKITFAKIENELNIPLSNVTATLLRNESKTDDEGDFFIPYVDNNYEIELTLNGYAPKRINNLDIKNNKVIILEKLDPDILYRLKRFIGSILNS